MLVMSMTMVINDDDDDERTHVLCSQSEAALKAELHQLRVRLILCR